MTEKVEVEVLTMRLERESNPVQGGPGSPEENLATRLFAKTENLREPLKLLQFPSTIVTNRGMPGMGNFTWETSRLITYLWQQASSAAAAVLPIEFPSEVVSS